MRLSQINQLPACSLTDHKSLSVYVTWTELHTNINQLGWISQLGLSGAFRLLALYILHLKEKSLQSWANWGNWSPCIQITLKNSNGFCLKPLSSGMFCYTVKTNWYTIWLLVYFSAIGKWRGLKFSIVRDYSAHSPKILYCEMHLCLIIYFIKAKYILHIYISSQYF